MYGFMTATDASKFLGISKMSIYRKLKDLNLVSSKIGNNVCFGNESAKKVFNFNFEKKIIALQIVKGGTGKTSLTHSIAIRMALFGARVLCIDLDQQGNLTQALNVNAIDKPIMADLLSGNDTNLTFKDLIVKVSPGIDLIPSRIDNATLDNIIMLKRFNLAKVYKDHIDSCKNNYDLIIIDCPPALGQSVTAVALSCDTVIAPVTPEEFSLSGLTLTYQEINDIRRTFDKKIGFRVLLNKFDVRTSLSHEVIQTLMKHEIFSELMYKIYIRNSQEFPNAIARGDSIFDVLKGTSAKEDIDLLLSEMFQCIPAKMEKN